MMERRFKIASINPDEIINVFLHKPEEINGIFEFKSLQILGVPEGTTVHSVHYDYHTSRLDIIIYHESFPIIPEGINLEKIEVKTKIVCTNQKGDIITTINELRTPSHQVNYRTDPLF